MIAFKTGTKFIPVISNADGRYLATPEGGIAVFKTGAEARAAHASYPCFRPTHARGFVGRTRKGFVVVFSSIYYDASRASSEWQAVTQIPC